MIINSALTVSFLMSPDNSTYTLPLDQAGTINYFCNVGDYCIRGIWGSIKIKDPNDPLKQSSNSNPNAVSDSNPSETSNDSPSSPTPKPSDGPNNIVKNIIIILSVLAGVGIAGGTGYLCLNLDVVNLIIVLIIGLVKATKVMNKMIIILILLIGITVAIMLAIILNLYSN